MRVAVDISPRWAAQLGGSAEILLTGLVSDAGLSGTTPRTYEGTLGVYYALQR